jgi:hypothetical protein
MTQDQYGQARDPGYVVSGQVVDDETEEYSDGQEKKMTAFQKVASALRGDRPDRDAPDQDVPENAGTTGQTLGEPDDRTAPDPSGAAVDPNGMATGQTSQDTFTPGTGAPDTVAPGTGTQETFARDAGAQDTVGQDTVGQDTTFGGQDPNGTDPNGAGATRGDYWDVPDARGTAQDQADGMTSPDRTPVTDADPLSRQDAADVHDVTATQPDVYDDGAAPVAAHDTAFPVAATDTDTTAPVAATTDADAAAPVATASDTDAGTTGTRATDAYPADAADTAYPADAADTAYPADAAATGAGTTAAAPQGAATISDAPVTQTSDDPAAAGPGRHAAAQAQELHPGEAAGLHPGEAAGSLDDLGDLAYGKLIPDAADFTAQWREVQLKFVDDPQASVTEAAAIVEQVTTKMEEAIQERQRAIAERQRVIAERQRAIQEQQSTLRGRWGEGSEADTETLRATLRMYKAFLDQLVGPKA